MNNTKVKICGLFRDIDIAYANQTMPDFIGFIFYPKSHRYVDVEAAKLFRDKLNKKILTVGVFVNEPVEDILRIAREVPLDIIQLHGDEDNSVIDKIRSESENVWEIWKAVRIKNSFDKSHLKDCCNADRFVMDTYVEGYGGEGKSFDWSLINGVDRDKLIIAGGIHADNVKKIIQDISPYSIDLSSGVETDKVKDLSKMEKLMKIVRGS